MLHHEVSLVFPLVPALPAPWCLRAKPPLGPCVIDKVQRGWRLRLGTKEADVVMSSTAQLTFLSLFDVSAAAPDEVAITETREAPMA